MTSMVAVPRYFEPFGLVPTTSYFGASAAALHAQAQKADSAQRVGARRNRERHQTKQCAGYSDHDQPPPLSVS
jgi:hypothetical protein